MGNIEQILSGTRINEPLAKHTTFRIGGPAKYFFEAKNEEDIMKAVKHARENQLNIFLLGGGSNILVSDGGFDGLVIKMENTGIEIKGDKVTAQSGTSLAELVVTTADRGLKGLEWASGIPGTVGGAVRGNAGCFGGEIRDGLIEAKVLRLDSLVADTIPITELQMRYRHSIIKESDDIILSGTFHLEPGDSRELKKVIKENLAKKHGSQPYGAPSSGCIFKNPSEHKAWEMIQDIGMQGVRIGGAQVSQEHANFIINTGGAKATDVITLISIIKHKIRLNYHGLNLAEEIQYVGF